MAGGLGGWVAGRLGGGLLLIGNVLNFHIKIFSLFFKKIIGHHSPFSKSWRGLLNRPFFRGFRSFLGRLWARLTGSILVHQIASFKGVLS